MPRVKGIETTRRGGRRKRKRCSPALQTNEEESPLLCSTASRFSLGGPARHTTTPLIVDNDSNDISFLSPAQMANTHEDSTIITPFVSKDCSRRSASGGVISSPAGMDRQTERTITENQNQPDQAAIHVIQRKTAAELVQETHNSDLQRVVLYDNHVSSPSKVESVQKLFEDCIQSQTGPLPEAIVAFIAAEMIVLTTTHPGWILCQNGLEGIYFAHDNSGKWTLRYRSSVILESIPEDKCNKKLAFMIVETVALLLLGIGPNDECKIDLGMLKSHICDNRYILQGLAWAAAFEALEHGHRDTAISMLDNDENFIKSAAFLNAMDGMRCSFPKESQPLDTTPTKLGYGDCNKAISMLDNKEMFVNSAAFLDALEGKSKIVHKGAKPVDMTPTKLFGTAHEEDFDFSKKTLEAELERAQDLVKLYETVLLLPETATTSVSCNSETSGEFDLQKGSVVKQEMGTFATRQNPAKYGRLLITIDSDDESECEV